MLVILRVCCLCEIAGQTMATIPCGEFIVALVDGHTSLVARNSLCVRYRVGRTAGFPLDNAAYDGVDATSGSQPGCAALAA